MGCCLSTGVADARRFEREHATKCFWHASWRCALVVRAEFVAAYNDGLAVDRRITATTFSDEYARLDAARVAETLERLGLPDDALRFVSHAIRRGLAQLPAGWKAPSAIEILDDLDDVDASEWEIEGFVCIVGYALGKTVQGGEDRA